MDLWNRMSRQPALNLEEAALLPALPPRRMTGGAALKNALDAARNLGEKQLSDPVTVSPGGAERPVGSLPPRKPGSRAALHQVLRPLVR